MKDIFKGSHTKQAMVDAIEKIEHHINLIRNASSDSRASLKIKRTIEDLEWEREKLLEKLKGV